MIPFYFFFLFLQSINQPIMKKITLFYYFISTLFATIQAQPPGSFYARISGDPSICAIGTRPLTVEYNKQVPPSILNPIDEYYPPFAITPYIQNEGLTSPNQLVPVPGSNPDDFFSSVFELPFQFRFFGINYDRLVVGSNGVLSFDIINNPAGGFCPYNLGPGNNNGVDIEPNGPNSDFPIKNAIYGVYQDINFLARPDSNTSINYYVKDDGIFAAPNRIFVLNYNRVLLYSDPNNINNLQTYQIILYESTNIIDINVVRRTQNPWVIARGGLLGIMNETGSKAYWPDNHNTLDAWSTIFGSTNTSESWRFLPKTMALRNASANLGDPYTSTLKWYKNNVEVPGSTDLITIIADADPLNEYQCRVTHYLPSGIENVVFSNKIKFRLEQTLTALNEPKEKIYICEGNTDLNTIDLTTEHYTPLLNNQQPIDYVINYYKTEDAAKTQNVNFQIFNLTDYSIPVGATYPFNIWVSIIFDDGSFCPPKVRKVTIYKNSTRGTFSYGDTAASQTDNFCLGTTTIRSTTVNTLIPINGTFYTNAVGANIIVVNSVTGAIDYSSAISGEYSVFYRFPIVEGCTAVPDLEVKVNVVGCGCTDTEFKICSSDTSFNLVAPVLPGAATYAWSGPGPNGASYSSNQQNPTFVPYPTGATSPFVYTLTIKDGAGIDLCTATKVSVISVPKSNAGTLTNPTNIFCDSNARLDLRDLLSGEDDLGSWSIVGVAPSDGSFNAATGFFTPSSLPFGTASSVHTFKYSVNGATPCGNTSKDFSITIINEPNPGTLVAGTNKTFCESETTPVNLFSLIENYNSGGTWTTTNTGGSLAATTGLYTIAMNATSGTFTYKVGGAPSVCPEKIVSVDLIIKKSPNSGIVTTGPNQYCDTSVIDIPLADLLTGEDLGGTWTRLGVQTDGTFTASAGTFRPGTLSTASSTSQFKYEVTNPPCLAKSTTVSLTVFNSPSAGTAITGQNLACEISTTPILLSSLLSSSDIGGTWDRISGTGGTFTNPIDAANASFTPALNATTSTFKYSVGLLSCGLDTEEVTITIKKAPISGVAKVNNNYCDNAITIQLADLLTGEDNNGTWTRGTGTYGNFSATGTFTPVAMTSTTTNVCTFIYTVAGLPCNNAITTVSLNIDKSPNAGTLNPTLNTYCDSDVNDILLSNLISGEDPGVWSQVSGAGGIFDSFLGTFKLTAGTTTSKFKYTVGANTACPKDEIEVTITVKPAANAGTAIAGGLVVCESDETVYKLADLLNNEQSGGRWTRLSGSGGVFDDVAGTYKSALGATSGVFQYKISGSSPCADNTASLVLTINPALIPIFTPVAPICKTDNLLALPTTSNNGVIGTWSPTISNVVTTEYTFKPNVGSCAFGQKMIIVVNDLPVITLSKDPFICVDITGLETTTALLTTGLTDALYIFEWFNETILTVIPLGTASSLTAIKIGTYRVDVTNRTTLCKSSAKVKVVSSLPPDSMTFVKSSYFEDEKTITVNVLPVSTYEYQIDNGVFQDSNQFSVITSGDHKIVVRDKFGCNQIEDIVTLLDYPKFFTPNGDGYNDLWTIGDLEINQPDTQIFIYDRFGKLMKQMTLASKGWDGTVNGVALPADDYWFTVNYDEGQIKKTFKSNFSLKR